MLQKILLEDVVKEMEAWRKAKKHKYEKLPEGIAQNIKALAKHHKRGHIARALNISGGTLNRALRMTKTYKTMPPAMFKEHKKAYPEKDWVPVKVEEKQEMAMEGLVTLELSLANQTTIRIRIAKSEAICFLQEVCHAATVVR